MSVGILKILELVTVQPPAISLTRFEAHFHDAGALIFQIMRRPNRLRRGIFPSGGPTPRLIRHGLVESDADFYFAGRHVPGAGNGGGLHHHWRLISMVGSISVCRKKPCSRGGHNCYCRQPEPEPEITVLSPGRFAQWSRRRSLGGRFAKICIPFLYPQPNENPDSEIKEKYKEASTAVLALS